MSLKNTYQKLGIKHWLILLGFWLFIAIIITNQVYFTSIKNGLEPDWITLFLDQLPIWLGWMLLTPVLIYVANRWSFESNNWIKPLLIHSITGLLILLLISNLTLVYMFTIHGYLDLTQATLGEYLPYFISRFTNDLLIFALVMMIIVIARSYSLRKNNQLNMALIKMKNDQLQSQLTQAQLQALKLQLNPHFLFNTLNTITSLTLIGENLISINMTSKLGEFLRRTLDFEEHQMVSLSKELEFFDLYLEIESVRFKDRLTLKRDVDPQCLDQKVPNLILQPLIENAMKYGIAKSKDACLIELKISQSGNFMEVELFNEGPLLPEKGQLTKGVGLSNIETRLEKLYERNHFFEVKNDILRQGVTSVIKIPVSQN
ncbi:MAG: histidine kinase [Ekhidna sp.]